MTDRKRVAETNRRSWNAATAAHNSHKKDQADFLRGGGTTLFREEIELLGDVRAKRLVHLQCNCGQDTLSLAALGAEVTGVDISDEAIAFAQRLAEDVGRTAKFVHSDVFDWFDACEPASFDVAFASYGALPWVSDLTQWMRGVAKVLRRGGRFVSIEFHPYAWSIDGDGRLVDSYFLPGANEEPRGVADYVARSVDGLTPMGRVRGVASFENPNPAVFFQYTVAECVQAVIDAGLTLTTLREYPYSNGCSIVDTMMMTDGRRFVPKEGIPSYPLMFAMVAHL